MKTVKKSVIPPATKGEDNEGVTALPGAANPVLPTDEETGIQPEGADENPIINDMDTQTVTALPGSANPALANPEAADTDEDPERAGKGRQTVIIGGKGNMPIYNSGAMRRVDRGEPVKLTKAELAYLDKAGVPYTHAKD